MHAAVEGSNSGQGGAPRNRRIGIIGAGPGGMAVAYHFREAGYDNIVMWERTEDFGGTWNINRYPGLECDIASHLYSFSFDPNPRWSKAFARQPEILAYLQGAADRLDLRRFARFSTEVTQAAWDEAGACWRVLLSTGEEETVDVLISALGMFNLIKWPDIAGLAEFKGRMVHTARWPQDMDLAGKRVAIIGSAATCVQMLPAIAEVVGHVDVFQRTPSWVLPKNDPVFDAETLAAREADSTLVAAERARVYQELDDFCRWPEVTDDSAFIAACIENLKVVTDPEVRAKLTPTFNWGCARPLFSNDFYPAFNRANVGLITDGASRITPGGIIDGTGVARDYDIIICATGYQVDQFLMALDVRGRDGIHIRDAWADGARAYLGITTHGFPNLFMTYGPNTNNSSLITMAEYEADYIVRHVEWMDANGVSWIDVKPEVEQAYNDALQVDIGKVRLWHGACHNYYFGGDGRIVTQYPHNLTAYRQATTVADWDKFEVYHRVMA